MFYKCLLDFYFGLECWAIFFISSRPMYQVARFSWVHLHQILWSPYLLHIVHICHVTMIRRRGIRTRKIRPTLVPSPFCVAVGSSLLWNFAFLKFTRFHPSLAVTPIRNRYSSRIVTIDKFPIFFLAPLFSRFVIFHFRFFFPLNKIKFWGLICGSFACYAG